MASSRLLPCPPFWLWNIIVKTVELRIMFLFKTHLEEAVCPLYNRLVTLLAVPLPDVSLLPSLEQRDAIIDFNCP